MRKNHRYLGVVILTALITLAASTRSASAAGAKCPTGGTPPPGSTVLGGLEVTGICVLDTVTIKGGVVVDPAGRLELENSQVSNGIIVNGGELDLGHALSGSGAPNYLPNTINGGIVFNGAVDVDLDGATIHGGVTLTGTLFNFPTMCGSTINGNVSLSDVVIAGFVNIGDATGDVIGFPCPGNQINGSVVVNNTSGFLQVEDNKITGTAVFLFDNDVDFSGNNVGGSALCSASTIVLPSGDTTFGNTVKGPINSCPN